MRQQAIALAGHRVLLFKVCERKDVRRVKESRILAGVARRFAEAIIEAAAPAAGDVCIDGVKDFAVALVGVKAFVQKMPEKAARLRDAEADGARHRERCV